MKQLHKASFGLLLLFAVPLVGGEQLAAQDIHFSQFRMSPLFLNPSMAGAFQGDLRAHLNYRDQWQQVGAPYRTFSFSADGSFFKDKWKGSHLGVGGFAYADKAGDAGFGSTRGDLAVSYNLAIDEQQFLSAGLQGGYFQQSVDRQELEWGSQYDGSSYDPDLPAGETDLRGTNAALDMSAGVSWRGYFGGSRTASNEGTHVRIGAAAHHLTRPERSLYQQGSDRRHIKYMAHGNARIGLPNSSWALVPGFMYALQGPASELLYGSMFRYGFKEGSKYTGLDKGAALSLGLHHRLRDALVASAMIEYSSYALGISYDINVSGLQSATNNRGGVEISLRFINPDPFNFGSSDDSNSGPRI